MSAAAAAAVTPSESRQPAVRHEGRQVEERTLPADMFFAGSPRKTPFSTFDLMHDSSQVFVLDPRTTKETLMPNFRYEIS